jgi:hypothetical protein
VVVLALIVALLAQPGLPHGILPGMTPEEVKARLGVNGTHFGPGLFDDAVYATYHHAELTITYKKGKACEISRYVPPPPLSLPPSPPLGVLP